MTRPNLQVNLKTFQRKWRIDPVEIRNYLDQVWSRLPRKSIPAPEHPVEVTVVFMNDERIQKYNRDYRKKNHPTDVLSFSVGEIQDHQFYLGDILISMERTNAQAIAKGHTILSEVKTLLLHGILHLLGYDHETDRGQMERLERRLRKILL